MDPNLTLVGPLLHNERGQMSVPHTPHIVFYCKGMSEIDLADPATDMATYSSNIRNLYRQLDILIKRI